MEMLSVTIGRGVLRQEDYLQGSIKRDISRQDRSSYKQVRVSDLVYNKMRAWQGAFGASNFDGLVSPAYVVLQPTENVHSWYYHHLLRSKAFWPEAEKWSYGLASDIWNLRPEHFRLIMTCRPPLNEQVQVVEVLESATSSLTRTINDVERAVTTMQEYHTRMITDVVTGAVDVREAARELPELDQTIRQLDDQTMEEEPLSMAAEGEEAYGEE